MTTKTKTSFGTVEIREYPVVLSNNPACDYGPSIELGWEYRNITHGDNDDNTEKNDTNTRVELSAYEKERQGKRRTTASKPIKLYLSQVKREQILLEGGTYTQKELNKATKEKSKARRQRSTSNFFRSPVAKVQATRQAGRRNKKVKRAVRNLNRETKEPQELFHEHDKIYKGWWLPFSEYLF